MGQARQGRNSTYSFQCRPDGHRLTRLPAMATIMIGAASPREVVTPRRQSQRQCEPRIKANPEIADSSESLWSRDSAASKPTTLPLGKPTPDAESFVVGECVLKTFDLNRTVGADLFRLTRRAALLREERLGVGLRAQRFVPPSSGVLRCRKPVRLRRKLPCGAGILIRWHLSHDDNLCSPPARAAQLNAPDAEDRHYTRVLVGRSSDVVDHDELRTRHDQHREPAVQGRDHRIERGRRPAPSERDGGPVGPERPRLLLRAGSPATRRPVARPAWHPPLRTPTVDLVARLGGRLTLMSLSGSDVGFLPINSSG